MPGYIDAYGNEDVTFGPGSTGAPGAGSGGGGGTVTSSGPTIHRAGVTAADTTDPATPTTPSATLPNGAVVPAAGQNIADFDVLLAGAGSTATVQPYFWNGRQARWFGAVAQAIGGPASTLVRVELRGRSCYLKVTALAGAGAVVNVDVSLS